MSEVSDTRNDGGRPPYTGKFLNPSVLNLVEEMVARKAFKSQIKDAVEKAVGERPSRSSMERLLADVRNRLYAKVQLSKSEKVAESLATYEAIIRSSTSKPAEKIKAQERIDALLGLDAKYADPQEGGREINIIFPGAEAPKPKEIDMKDVEFEEADE